MPDAGRISAALDAIERDPAMRPMGALVSGMTVAGGFALGESIHLVLHHRLEGAALALAVAAVLLLPLAVRMIRRRCLRGRLAGLGKELHDA
jgi:uncharacterized membrane protein (UPF0136 family)